jgi:hypothetical protein
MRSTTRSGPRIVSAATFAAWWMKLVELSEEQPDDNGIYNLITTLYDVGRRSRATEPHFSREARTPETPLGVYRREWRLAPDFDWITGEIDISGLRVEPETLVATLVRTTGIKEHDVGDDVEPMVERMHPNDEHPPDPLPKNATT